MNGPLIVQREELIHAPLERVWQLVATEEGLRQWWGNRIALEANEGGQCEEWRSEGNQIIHWRGVVTRYAPPHELVMTLRAQGPQQDGAALTTIAIALAQEGQTTRIQVTQRAFAPAPVVAPSLPETATPPTKYRVPLAQLGQHGGAPSVSSPSLSALPAIPLTARWQQRLATLVTLLDDTNQSEQTP
jgi:uncharacterized protein YndB with AHSA1/START domain